MGPYLPFCSLKYPSFGIAIALGWFQSVVLGASTGCGCDNLLSGSVEVAISFLLGLVLPHLCSGTNAVSDDTPTRETVFRRWLAGCSATLTSALLESGMGDISPTVLSARWTECERFLEKPVSQACSRRLATRNGRIRSSIGVTSRLHSWTNQVSRSCGRKQCHGHNPKKDLFARKLRVRVVSRKNPSTGVHAYASRGEYSTNATLVSGSVE